MKLNTMLENPGKQDTKARLFIIRKKEAKKRYLSFLLFTGTFTACLFLFSTFGFTEAQAQAVLSRKELTLSPGQSDMLSIKSDDTLKKIKWTYSKNNTIKVKKLSKEKVRITALSAGKARIKATVFTETAEGKQQAEKTGAVSIRILRHTISSDYEKAVMIRGTSLNLHGTCSAGDPVSYKSSNPEILKIDQETGTMQALSEGSCQIIIKCGYGEEIIPAVVKDRFSRNDITFIGHRGDMENAPENTIAAFEKAAESGYAGFECDVWPTDSGEFFICHNPTLLQMFHTDLPATALSSDNRMSYPVVSGNHVNDYPVQYAPSLEEAVQTAKAGRMHLILHEKKYSITPDEIERIMFTIQSSNYEDHTVIMTSSPRTLQLLSGYYQNLIFLTIHEETADEHRKTIRKLAKHDIPYYGFNYPAGQNFDRKTVMYAHKMGIKVFAYNVLSYEDVSRAIGIGVDEVMTNTVMFEKDTP